MICAVCTSIQRILSSGTEPIAYFHSIRGHRVTLRIRPSSDLYTLCLRVGECVTRPSTTWEHLHDGTYPPSVTQHIQFSIFPHSKSLIHAPNQTAIISPLYIIVTLLLRAIWSVVCISCFLLSCEKERGCTLFKRNLYAAGLHYTRIWWM